MLIGELILFNLVYSGRKTQRVARPEWWHKQKQSK